MEALIREAVRTYHQLAISLSDDLYDHPELGDEEVRSSAKIAEILKTAGYKVQLPFAGRPTAFCGVLGDGEPKVGILVEYDALPGLGHACGHNAHGAMAVLTALALAKLKPQLPGTVYVFGTPAEEACGAKIDMAEQGVFDGLSLALMIHSWSGGQSVADMDVLSLRHYAIEFRGQAAHAVAGAWNGRSALAAARKFLDLVDARRECFTPDVHVNSVITAGGLQPSILPDRAEVHTEFRTDSMAKLERVNEMILKCARGACLALDCELRVSQPIKDFYDMVRVPELEEAAAQQLRRLGQTVAGVQLPNGSSDVGNVSYHCPAIQPLLSISDAFYPLHTPEFREATRTPQAHEAIAVGAELMTSLVCRVMTDAAFRQTVYASFQRQKAAKKA